MKFTEIKDKETKELTDLLKNKKSELFESRLKLKTMQLSNPNEIRTIKRDIARIKTAMQAKRGE